MWQWEGLRLLHCIPLLVHVLLQPSTHVHKIAALCGMCEWVCGVMCVVCDVCKYICVCIMCVCVCVLMHVCVCVCVYDMCGRKNSTQSLEWNADIVRQDWNGKHTSLRTELGDYQDVTGSGMAHEYHWSRRRTHLGGALTAGLPACSSATAPNYDDCSRIVCQPYPLTSPQLSNVLHVYETPANTLCVLMIYAMWLL